MEIKGKIVQILQAVTGNSARGEWKRQDFIIETQEQYPKKVCIQNFNGKADLEKFGVGTTVNVSINIESREYNEKWYTSVNVWKMESAGQGQNSNQGYTPSASDIPPPATDEMPQEEAPF